MVTSELRSQSFNNKNQFSFVGKFQIYSPEMLQDVSLKPIIVFLFGFIVSYKEVKSSSKTNFFQKKKFTLTIRAESHHLLHSSF